MQVHVLYCNALVVFLVVYSVSKNGLCPLTCSQHLEETRFLSTTMCDNDTLFSLLTDDHIFVIIVIVIMNFVHAFLIITGCDFPKLYSCTFIYFHHLTFNLSSCSTLVLFLFFGVFFFLI
jgi:hypothetical protein